MNKPANIRPAPSYETDGYGWANAQARLIRDRRLDAIDWDNVAEEIESVGKSELSSAESALRVLMVHILKWQSQSDRRGRSWLLTIMEQRIRYADVMDQNLSLKVRREEMRLRAYRRARIEAAREMDVDLDTLPEEAPDWQVLLDQPFAP